MTLHFTAGSGQVHHGVNTVKTLHFLHALTSDLYFIVCCIGYEYPDVGGRQTVEEQCISWASFGLLMEPLNLLTAKNKVSTKMHRPGAKLWPRTPKILSDNVLDDAIDRRLGVNKMLCCVVLPVCH